MQIIFVLATSYYYLAHYPAQVHNSVHANPCLPLLQCLQDFLQLHLISSLHVLDASGSSLHQGMYPVWNFFHPHPTIETGFGCLYKHLFHKLASNAALQICCFNTPAVGGMFSMLCLPLANRICQALLTCSVLQLGL